MSCCMGRSGKESKACRGEFKNAERRPFNGLKDIEFVRIHCNDDGYYSRLDNPPVVHLNPADKRQVTTCEDDRTCQQSIHPQVETASVTSFRRRDSMYSIFKGLTTLPGSEFYQLKDVISPETEEYQRMTRRASSESDHTSIRDQNPINNCDALGLHYPASDRPRLPPFPWELPQRPARAAVRDPRNSANFGESGCTDNLFSRIPPKPVYRDLNSNPLPSRRTPVVPTRSSSSRSNRSMSSQGRRPILSYRESQEFLRPRPAPSVPGQGQRQPTMEPLRINTSVQNEGQPSTRGTQQRPSQAFLPENQRPPPPSPPSPPRTSSSRNHHHYDGQSSTSRRVLIDLTPLRPPPPPPIRRRPVGAPPLQTRTIRAVPRSPPTRLPGSCEVEQQPPPELQERGPSWESRQILQQQKQQQQPAVSKGHEIEAEAAASRVLHIIEEESHRPSRFRERLDSNGISPCSPEEAGRNELWRNHKVSPLSPVVVVPPDDENLGREERGH